MPTLINPLQSADLTENRLLADLSLPELDRLTPKMHLVRLEDQQTIHTAGEVVRSVYFPVTAVLAQVNTLENGNSLAVGVVGNEGMACLPVFLGADSEPYDLVVQVPGKAYRMVATVLGEESGHIVRLRDLLLRYTQAFLSQITQTAACSRHHLVKQRLATWLLMLCDRTSTDQLPMTHEFLARMLGVGRPSITLTIDGLQKSRVICHSRGIVTIVDRPGLEAAACECYQLMRDDHDRLLRDNAGAGLGHCI